MDPGMLSIANAMTDMRQSQIQTAVQMQLLQMAMDSQTQAVEELLQASSGTVPTNPNLGNHLDMYV
ncbi:MAG TPA: YjfB family protein [Bacillota bacterium]|nr:YjfB family protein [Bacillota bacterium]